MTLGRRRAQMVCFANCEIRSQHLMLVRPKTGRRRNRHRGQSRASLSRRDQLIAASQQQKAPYRGTFRGALLGASQCVRICALQENISPSVCHYDMGHSFGVVGVAPWVRALQEIILQKSTEALRLCSIINHSQNLHL